MSIIGFTGTRIGMTAEQRRAFNHIILVSRIKLFLNGAALGADRQALEVMELYPKVEIELYPGDPAQMRWAKQFAAHRDNVRIRGVLPYLRRNRIIAERCDTLIAVPSEAIEIVRSGTWMTVRAARHAGKTVTIIEPDGTYDFSP